ncbi:MAG: hypothetical protein HFE90_06580 [Firmicutes bacterium]|nr:hypothetical protein [Bacillota bacterium]
MGNLQQGKIDWSDLVYSNDQDDIEKYRLEVGDVFFNRTNSSALVDKTSIYRGECPAIYAGYLIKLDYNHDIILGDFLNYTLNASEAKAYCNSVKTIVINLSGEKIIIPNNKENIKLILGFLDEEAYKGSFSQNAYIVNSKCKVV